MSNYAYSNDTLTKLTSVCKEPAVEIVSSFPNLNLSIVEVEITLHKIYKFVGESFSDLGAMEYIIELNLCQKQGTPLITKQLILDEKRSGNIHHEVSHDIGVLKSSKFSDLSDTKLSRYSRDHKSVMIFVTNGLDTKIFCHGVIIAELNALSPTSSPRVNKRTRRTAKDYKYSIIDFYRERVRNNITSHWADKQKRLLKGGKTEDLFQDGLANWLHENLDAKVLAKVKKLSADETDIEIIDIDLNTYLIEIKWLGKNQAGTSNGEPKIRDAIQQVATYLNIDTTTLEATLVVYDGRPWADFEKIKFETEEKGNWKCINECLSNKLPLRGKGFVFFLISDPASKRSI